MKTPMFLMSILAAANVGLSEASSASEAAVTVRTYNYTAMSLAHLATAKLEAEHIFRRTGISLQWIECRVPGREDGEACTEPLLPGRDLMLRLVDRTPAHGERIVALGESMLDRGQRGGVLMTVDLFAVRQVAAGASTAMLTLLARAIAHEMGHLLLGSTDHPRLGLMRALWSHDELRGLKPAHWGFSAREAARMREKLRRKPSAAA